MFKLKPATTHSSFSPGSSFWDVVIDFWNIIVGRSSVRSSMYMLYFSLSPPPHTVLVDSLHLDATFDLPLKYPHQFLPQCSRTMRHFFITFPLSPPFVAYINPCRMTTTQCCRLCDRCLPTEMHLERRTCPKPWGLSSSAVVSGCPYRPRWSNAGYIVHVAKTISASLYLYPSDPRETDECVRS